MEDDNDLDYWIENCGCVPNEGCRKAGSEECDFECPMHEQYVLFLRMQDIEIN